MPSVLTLREELLQEGEEQSASGGAVQAQQVGVECGTAAHRVLLPAAQLLSA